MNLNKIKTILTSKIAIGVICFILGGAILGSAECTLEHVQSGSVETNGEGTSTESEKAEGNKSDENSNKKPQSGLLQMNLGESYEITNSSDEQYKVAIEGIRFTDERNQYSEKTAEHVVFLDFNYENINSVDEVYVFESHFKVMDDQGNILDTYPVSDSNRSSKTLPIGAKCSSTAAYAMPTSSKTLKVLYYDNMFGKPLGEVTIETGL